jgi:hypothetical protein
MNEIIITKQISKQGIQSVLIIPSVLRDKLKPKTLVEARIKVIEIGELK